jgi:hypothetical protein
MADSAARSGNNAEARALTGVRSALLDQMPDAYNAARKQYATDKSVEEAFTEGRGLFASRSDGQVFDPDLLRARIDGMSQPEQDAYRMGARKAVSDVMGQSRSDPAGLQTKLANPDGYAVGKLSTVFGEQPTNALLSELDKVKGFQATNNLALSGPRQQWPARPTSSCRRPRLWGAGRPAMECSVLCRLGQLVSAAVHWLAVRLERYLVSRTWVWRLAQLEGQRAPLRLHSSTPAGWRRREQTAQLKRGC